MKNSTTIILLVLAAGLLLFIILFEKEQPGTRERAATTPVSFEAEEAELITISRAGETVSIRKDEGTWLITLPFEDRADQAGCLGILESLTEIRILETIRHSEVDSGKLDLHEIYLAPGDGVTITVFGGGGPMAAVRIGRSGALANTCYATFPGNERLTDIYVLQSNLGELASRPVATLRDPKLFHLPLEEIGRVLITGDNSATLELVRDSRTRLWKIAKPFTGRADQKAVDALVNRIREVEVIAPVDGGAAATGASFGNSSISLWPVPEGFASVVPLREVGDGPESRVRLEIDVPPSGAAGDPAPVLGRISQREVLFQLSGKTSELFALDPESFRDPFLAQIPDRSIRGIVISSPGNPDVMLSSNGKIWTSLRNGAWEGADAVAVEQLMDALNEERILEYIPCEDPARLGDYGLNPPSLRIGLTTSTVGASPDLESEPPVTTPDPDEPLLDEYSLSYVLGISSVQSSGSDDPSDPGKLYAKFADEQIVLSIDPAFFNQVPNHPLKWRSRSLLHFNIVSLREIRLTDSASGLAPTRLTYDFLVNGWKLHLGEEDLTARLNFRSAFALVDALSALRVQDWLANREAALQALGSPDFSVEIDLAYPSEDGSGERIETTELQFAPVSGDPSDRLFYGRLDDSPEVFLIERSSIDALRASLLKAAD